MTANWWGSPPHDAHAGRPGRHRNPPAVDHDEWREIAHQLIARNGGGNLGIYLHVSRGTDNRRNHAYPDDITPTTYAFAFDIPPPRPDKAAASCYTVATTEDMRWKRCNIKSTALLGNVMHYQHGHAGATRKPFFTTRTAKSPRRPPATFRGQTRHWSPRPAGSPETAGHHPPHAVGDPAPGTAIFPWRSGW